MAAWWLVGLTTSMLSVSQQLSLQLSFYSGMIARPESLLSMSYRMTGSGWYSMGIPPQLGALHGLLCLTALVVVLTAVLCRTISARGGHSCPSGQGLSGGCAQA